MYKLKMRAWFIVVFCGLSMQFSQTGCNSGVQTPSGADNMAASAPKPKWLNNLVAELLDVKGVAARDKAIYRFNNPREGWIFVSSTARVENMGELALVLDPDGDAQKVINHDGKGISTLEAMRHIPAGPHHIKVEKQAQAELEHLVVRAIPELIYGKFGWQRSHVPHEPYDWDFMQKYIVDNANVIVGTRSATEISWIKPIIESWKKQQKRWLIESGATPFYESWNSNDTYELWTSTDGLDYPQTDGIIVDEFYDNEKKDKDYIAVCEAVRRIQENPKYKDKLFYPYVCSRFDQKYGRKFIQMVLDAGWMLSWERYLEEKETLASAQECLRSRLVEEVAYWKKQYPGSLEQMIVCFSYMSTIPEFSNANPSADYKVWMDMQFNMVANHPAFLGVRGFQEYQSGSANDEAVRWASRLYRHYGIEGKTTMLSKEFGYKYELDHIVNPDFDYGLKGWRITEAQPHSIAVKEMKDFGDIEGRYPSRPAGSHFLWTKRSKVGPNICEQEIKNLVPDRLYSMKLFTADYQDISGGKSVEKKDDISISIEPVEMIEQKCFDHLYPNYYAHTDPFTWEHHPWLNFHFRVFRAKTSTAKLEISDWKTPAEPGGPIGQEMMYNFVEVQPYFDE